MAAVRRRLVIIIPSPSPVLGFANPSGRLPITLYYNNYTVQQPMANMNMTTFPGRTYRCSALPLLL